MYKNLFIQKKKRKLDNNTEDIGKITKKRKTLNNLPRELQYVVSDSKVLNLRDNNELSWRDSSDNSISKFFDKENEDLPSSMKVEKNIVIPPREVHNDLLL